MPSPIHGGRCHARVTDEGCASNCPSRHKTAIPCPKPNLSMRCRHPRHAEPTKRDETVSSFSKHPPIRSPGVNRVMLPRPHVLIANEGRHEGQSPEVAELPIPYPKSPSSKHPELRSPMPPPEEGLRGGYEFRTRPTSVTQGVTAPPKGGAFFRTSYMGILRRVAFADSRKNPIGSE